MRLIDADLLKSSDEMTKVFNNLTNEMYGMLQLIDEQPTVSDQKWIKCSDRFPKEFETRDGYIEPSDHVLIQDDCENLFVSRYWGSRRSKQENDSSWIDLKYNRNIIAWMELPSNFKESEE